MRAGRSDRLRTCQLPSTWAAVGSSLNPNVLFFATQEERRGDVLASMDDRNTGFTGNVIRDHNLYEDFYYVGYYECLCKNTTRTRITRT